jgi:hypothetical protein
MDIVCNICNSNSLKLVLSLPKYPLNTIYLKRISDESDYSAQDLNLYCCNKCSHFQASSDLSLKELYNNDYNYHTENPGVQGRIAFFLNQLEPLKTIKFNRLIDVGCFDLSLLKTLKKVISANCYIGIDPSIPDDVMNKNGEIICYKEYCDSVILPHSNSELPDLIISDQTFEHIPGINKSLHSIISQVHKDSFFAVCVPNIEILIEKLNFHNIIHEHVNYFSIHTLTRLFDEYRLSLHSYTIEYNSTCGFLFAIYSKRKNVNIKIPYNNIYTKEYFLIHYDIFKNSIAQSMKIINNIKNEKVYGFGASDITSNIAYFMNSDFSFLTNILDDTGYKQKTYFPFLKPEIINPTDAKSIIGSNCLITAPQAARYLYKRLLAFGFKRIINPIGLIS